MRHYRNADITETEFGCVLSHIEYQYALIEFKAEEDLEKGIISQSELDAIIQEAEYIWLGESSR